MRDLGASSVERCTEISTTAEFGGRVPKREALSHTPSIAFRHLPPKKDVVNQCLESGDRSDIHSSFHFCFAKKICALYELSITASSRSSSSSSGSSSSSNSSINIACLWL